MDTRFIEVRKNILISRLINGGSTFSATIDIDFIPDEMIVRNIMYTIGDPGAPQNISTSTYSNIVSDYIGTFSDIPSGNSVVPNLAFTLRKPIRGVYNFNILVAQSNTNDNDMIPQNRAGYLSINLEFVKYRTDLPDKKIF